MRNLAVPLALALILSACAKPAPPPLPTSTSTPPPSATPSPTPKPTFTPTPPGPDGATGKDADGRWIKVEDGKTYIYMDFPAGSEMFNGWFESRMARGPINLTGYGESIYGDIPVNLNVYFVQDLEGFDNIGYLIHPDGPSDNIKLGLPWTSFSTTLVHDLFTRYYGFKDYKTESQKYSGFKTEQDKQRFFNDMGACLDALNNGATMQVGDENWQPRKGYDVYWINPAAAKADPSMHLVSPDTYWKVMVLDGKLTAVLATTWLHDKMKDKALQDSFRKITLFPLEATLREGNLRDVGNWPYYDLYGAMAGPNTTVNGKQITSSFIAFVSSR